MEEHRRKFRTIDEYIDGFPTEVRKILEKIRRTIRKAAPKVDEAISYQIPTFKFSWKPDSFRRIRKAHWLLSGGKGDQDVRV